MHHQKQIPEQLPLKKQGPAKTGLVIWKTPGIIPLNIPFPIRLIKQLKNQHSLPNTPPIPMPMVTNCLLIPILPDPLNPQKRRQGRDQKPNHFYVISEI
jgi:hypothetical protein